MYSGGIFSGCQKDAIINHAVVAEGFGQQSGTKFYLIKNSWGADWGDKGYIRLMRLMMMRPTAASTTSLRKALPARVVHRLSVFAACVASFTTPHTHVEQSSSTRKKVVHSIRHN